MLNMRYGALMVGEANQGLVAKNSEVERLRARITLLEERIEALDTIAHRDPLTGLPNRRGLMRAIAERAARMERHGLATTLLYGDVDGLKTINDSHGHAAGDAALAHLARVFGSVLRVNDFAARLSGDEFCILLDDSRPSADRVIARIEAAMQSDVFTYEGAPIALSLTLGAAPFDPGMDAEAMLNRADRAMYARKTSPQG